MDFSVLTIFPELINPFSNLGIIGRSIERDLISVSAINIRDFAKGKHKVTDDRPYGGGCGMVMKPEPLAAAIKAAKKKNPSAITIHLTPQGRPFNQKLAHELLDNKGLILICGRYEGVDERITHNFIDDEISIGDYVLTGGEIAALVIIDAVTRLIPGSLGGIDSADKDSFEDDLLEHGHYTRPKSFMGDEVPEVLLSGNHAEIEKWRLETSLIRTFLKRPDLLKKRQLNTQEINILKKWRSDLKKLTHA
ncbi:MAG: tRNA (guanosine(37)-N1)-methyltransferase TrmD [Desulfobacterales bacterium]|jgi:tRNA (guanine37-N1)-methyltransferase|nr:tRNA (guanosine(37)-N1)-methyltransferase TrmD [Desulfobacteraceae bacterium]MBT4363876.1 tRNA (guanosine(37)-N1)-methyltransferase TrmD [Desulfobacteraceae bacterium]MBT7086603.1 tRNA (guanosine(37)-N1)-methyltransferase TrmD [Desulfobacterales bacterium]